MRMIQSLYRVKKTYYVKGNRLKKFGLMVLVASIFMTGAISYSETSEVNAADYLNQVGILKGANGDYGLNKSINRLEGLILILRTLGLEETALALNSEPSVFSDVPSWAVGYTNLASAYQVTSGTGGGRFSPSLPMTRDQFLMLMLRAMGAELPSELSKASESALAAGLIDEQLLNSFTGSVFYKGDVANVLARLVHQSGVASAITLTYWTKPDGMDPVKLATFQKDIQSIFNTVKAKYKLNYNMAGFYVEELNTGYSWSFGDELVYEPTTGLTKGKLITASAIKFPMALSVLTHMEANGIKLSDTFKDSLSGKTLRFDQVIKPMISQSTNDSFNYLLRYMGKSKVNGFMASVGVVNSVINRELGGGDPYWSLERMKKDYGTEVASKFTPTDYGTLLRYFYGKVKAGNPYMAFLNQCMIDNIHQTRIPQGINYKYTVAHKTGSYTDGGIYADVGIVYHPNNPYSIVILLDTQTLHASCEPFMRELASAINAYMEKR